jgi:transcriptional regulator with XRE-family HTH domain
MKTHSEIASVLRHRLAAQGITQASLRETAGIAQRTLTNVLSGDHDFKVSTLLALADRLGLEMVLAPKGAAAGVEIGQTSAPNVPTRIQAALDRIKNRADGK